jgi:phosphatidate cytidylyltransferase
MLAWGSDTGAYFAGKYLGKQKLYEKVSPKKTWAGAIGGVITATLGAFGLTYLYGAPKIDPIHLALIAPVATVLGQIGDLAESLLKRSVGVKDSGKIMPGHGGLLDRVDALVFAGPALLAYAMLVLQQVPTYVRF